MNSPTWVGRYTIPAHVGGERRWVMYYFANQIDGAGSKMYSGLNETESRLLKDMGNPYTKYDVIEKLLAGIDFDSILDIGCGDGELISQLVRGKNISAFGVDGSKKMIEAARKRLGGDFELSACNCMRLQWDKNSFDVLVCDGLFRRFTDPEGVIHEMKRVIKHGGSLIITGARRPGRIRRIFDFGGSSDICVYPEDEVIDLLGRSGFFVEDWENSKDRGYVLRALAIR